MSFAAALRSELNARAKQYADLQALPHCQSYGDAAVVCFERSAETGHGNFLRESYRAICEDPEWRRRLSKVHTSARRSLPQPEQGRWRELDSCMSSDALLMNVFCFPRLLSNSRIAGCLAVERFARPSFGVPARVPLESDRVDRTEIDMRLGSLMVEAKLTESDFQRAPKAQLLRYRDFAEVFDADLLPQSTSHFYSYQLIRNVLAAHVGECSFGVLVDRRRPDLVDAFYAVVKCIRPADLRTRCRVLTWQELAAFLPARLKAFLAAKYGIAG